MVTCPGLAACASGADAHACQTQATPGSRRLIRDVTHSQAPFAPAASPSPAHSADTQAGTQVSGQEQVTAPPRVFAIDLVTELMYTTGEDVEVLDYMPCSPGGIANS